MLMLVMYIQRVKQMVEQYKLKEQLNVVGELLLLPMVFIRGHLHTLLMVQNKQYHLIQVGVIDLSMVIHAHLQNQLILMDYRLQYIF